MKYTDFKLLGTQNNYQIGSIIEEYGWLFKRTRTRTIMRRKDKFNTGQWFFKDTGEYTPYEVENLAISYESLNLKEKQNEH